MLVEREIEARRLGSPLDFGLSGHAAGNPPDAIPMLI
jgi:hypothetical protein